MQRDALNAAIGQRAGEPVDELLVAMAVLGLLRSASRESPVVCIVDDLQWLDIKAPQILGFVTRRLADVPVAVVMAVHTD